MKHAMLAPLLALGAALAQADEAPLPTMAQEPVSAGQTWTYKRVLKTPAATTESRTIFRAAQQGPGGELIIESMPAQLTGRPTLWHRGPAIGSNSCMLDVFGTGSLGIINSCATTFSPGMDWTTESQVQGKRVLQRYEVVDMESVTVAAGSFNAVRIEAQWETPGGRSARPTHKVTYWYAPEARAMAKVHRQFLNSKGAVESEATEELERFRQTIAR